MTSPGPHLSIVVPVYNEEATLPELFRRLVGVLDAMARPWELLFVNDGSRDGSLGVLRELHRQRPREVRIVDLNGNFGQHTAIMAGFERVRGDVVVTLDADLQNPPEEIPRLVAAVEAGHDVAGGCRRRRFDSLFRRWASRVVNGLRARLTPLRMRDQGCMLRAYRRSIVDAIAASQEAAVFIPALAESLAVNPIDVEVEHAPRGGGTSAYGLYRLIRLNFDLVTGFSLLPLQLFTMCGMLVATASLLLVVHLVIRRLVIGPEVEGVFTLFAILFFLVGLGILGLGIIGEYVGRIYQEVRRRPRYVVREIIGDDVAKPPRVVVFAYHEVGCECLDALLDRGVDVIAVFTHEDDPSERSWFRSVAELASTHGIPVFRPADVNTAEWVGRLGELHPDLILSFYYRRLLSNEILALPPLGAYNVHGSLLPRYRGCAPVNWAVLRGEVETGATLHVMVAAPDAGDVVDQARVPIGPQDTAREVYARVTSAARRVVHRQLDNLLTGNAPRRPQDEARATRVRRRRPDDGRISWDQDATTVFNLVRAVTHPYPGAFTDFGGRRLYVWWARPLQGTGAMAAGAASAASGEVVSAAPLVIETGKGSLEVLEWQWEDDGAPRSGEDHGLRKGHRLGCAVCPAADVAS